MLFQSLTVVALIVLVAVWITFHYLNNRDIEKYSAANKKAIEKHEARMAELQKPYTSEDLYADAREARAQQKIDGKMTIFDLPSWRIRELMNDHSLATDEERDAMNRFHGEEIY